MAKDIGEHEILSPDEMFEQAAKESGKTVEEYLKPFRDFSIGPYIPRPDGCLPHERLLEIGCLDNVRMTVVELVHLQICDHCSRMVQHCREDNGSEPIDFVAEYTNLGMDQAAKQFTQAKPQPISLGNLATIVVVAIVFAGMALITQDWTRWVFVSFFALMAAGAIWAYRYAKE